MTAFVEADSKKNSGDAVGFKENPSEALLTSLGQKLRRLRTSQGYSLERFSKMCSVSRGMLGQIENGKSMPTIGVLWKIATALNIPFAQLIAENDTKGSRVLRREETPIIVSKQGGFQSRALFPYNSENRTEFYELRLAPNYNHVSESHATGTKENLVVTSGVVEIKVGNHTPVSLAKGDAIFFEADVPHAYRNLGDIEAIIYLVVSYQSTHTQKVTGHQ